MATMPNSPISYTDLIQPDRISGRVYYDQAVFRDEIGENLASRMGLCRP